MMRAMCVVIVLVLMAGCEKPAGTEARKGGGDGKLEADFADNTAKYKGKTVTLKLRVGSVPGKPLQEARGQDVQFRAASKNAHLSMMVFIPPALNVPNADFGDHVTVTFICKEGAIGRGNEATEIVRTPQ